MNRTTSKIISAALIVFTLSVGEALAQATMAQAGSLPAGRVSPVRQRHSRRWSNRRMPARQRIPAERGLSSGDVRRADREGYVSRSHFRANAE